FILKYRFLVLFAPVPFFAVFEPAFLVAFLGFLPAVVAFLVFLVAVAAFFAGFLFPPSSSVFFFGSVFSVSFSVLVVPFPFPFLFLFLLVPLFFDIRTI